jgi:hypothetical protein
MRRQTERPTRDDQGENVSRIARLVLLAAACALALPACPVDEVPESGSATGGAIIEVEVDDSDDVAVVDFGEVNAGDSAERSVTIRNIGAETLQLQALSLSNIVSFEIVDRDDVAALLAPGETTSVTLRYSPSRDEHIEADLTVESNDRETPSTRLRLVAEGIAPEIRIEPESFDFGNIQLGCVNVVELTLHNVGRAPLQLNNIWFEDLSANGEMVLIHSIPAGAVVRPGRTETLEVHYVPIDVDPDTGILHIETNDPARSDKTASQSGAAHLGESNRDEFVQTDTDAADILWVVDNSLSMADEQASLSTNLPSFVQFIDDLELDYHVGVLTMDTVDSGALQGAMPFVTSSTTDPVGTFAASVDVGTGGSATSQGFQSVLLCYSSGDCLSGFDRGNAAGLRIIFVSDGQEQSTALGTVADYVNYFYSLRADPDKLILSDISGGLAGCSGPGGGAGSGADYVAATVVTGGVSASICDSDWTATLSALAWLSKSFSDTFELSQTPVRDTIEVWVNDTLLSVGWTFNSALNSIVFDVSRLPDPDDTIVVEYTVLGDCGD